jgi:hypothetical protein
MKTPIIDTINYLHDVRARLNSPKYAQTDQSRVENAGRDFLRRDPGLNILAIPLLAPRSLWETDPVLSELTVFSDPRSADL